MFLEDPEASVARGMCTIPAMVIVIMGVAGSGKTAVGRALAQALGFTFVDADDLHPPANIAKMAHHIPLDDADRAPWLATLKTRLAELQRTNTNVVLACSALKERFRSELRAGITHLQCIYLKTSAAVLKARLAKRTEHFMPADLLPSQFAALEEPHDAIVVDGDEDVATIVAEIRERVTNS